MEDYIFKSIIQHATDAVIVTESFPIDEPEGPKIVYVNDSYLKMTGYSRDEVIGKTPRILQGPETDRKELDKLKHALKTGQPAHAELINYKKNEEKFWTSISIFPVEGEQSSDIKYWVGIKRDITAKKEATEEHKSTLQELHHRVKNNLSLISSLLQLEALKEEDTHLNNKLLELTTRIKSIAGIYELLYKQNSLTHIDVADSLRELTNQIQDILAPEKDIITNFDIGEIESLNINQAAPLALIVNEVITNSIKHGFQKRDKGKITFNLHVHKKEIDLTIKDNGQGLPDDFTPDSNTTGMELINVLTEQLHGKFTYRSLGKGTEFQLQFAPRNGTGAYSGF